MQERADRSVCTSVGCPLFGKKKVDFYGPQPSFGMLIGEAPGVDEEATGYPFIGRSGEELTQYMYRAELNRDMFRIGNILSCRPDNNKNPTDDMIAACRGNLLDELYSTSPQFIGAIGGFATRFFLGQVSLEYVHGIPFTVDSLPDGTKIPKCTVVPCYHPALGLRATEMMSHTQMDFTALAHTIQGKLKPRRLNVYKQREVDYRLITDPSEVELSDRVAIDTEWAKGRPWCITWSTGPNMARMVMADNEECLKVLKSWWENPDVECDIHNALYDIPVLWQLGIHPETVVDTMVMAYLLQIEPQGLKPLTYRHLNIQMTEYKKVVGVANQTKALNYLNYVMAHNWDDPEPIERWVANKLKPKYPSNIRKRIQNILKSVVKDYEATGKVQTDIYDRWHNIKDEEGRGMVEEALGKMQMGDLSDIDFETAKTYSCQDADVLWQLKPLLWERIQALDLDDVFWTDMHIIPMISDMMVRGAKIDPDHFHAFSKDLNRRMEDINNRIDEIAGRHINPESWMQTLSILMDRGTYKYPQSTDEKHLSKYKTVDPLVGLILEHRGLKKLDCTYAKPIPKLADKNNRVHTRIRTTRVATGRISSADPNLTNQPTKNEDGKNIRKGFIAEEGNIIMAADFCLAPGTKILTEDLKWTNIENAKVGDKLWGIDEYPKGIDSNSRYRKMRVSTIQHIRKRKLPCYKITMDDGKEIISSAEHSWFAKGNGIRRYDWIKTKNISPGMSIRKICDTWDFIDEWESGYIAGMMDGEGSITDYSGKKGDILTFVQKAGKDFNRIYDLFNKYKFRFHSPCPKRGGFPGSRSVNYTWICNRAEIARFFGMFRPPRLMEKANMLFNNKRPPRGLLQHVVSIDYIGEHDTIAIQTDTRTFIAEGYATHNSQIELRVLAHESQDWNMLNCYAHNKDLHTYTAKLIFKLSGGTDAEWDAFEKEVRSDRRRRAKCVNFGIAYGLSAVGLYKDLISQGVQTTIDECQAFIDAWFGAYPDVYYWLDKKKAEAKRTGMVRDLFGRIRLCPEGYAADIWIRRAGERQAINTPIQSGAQGVVKRAMVQLTPYYKEFNQNSYGHVWWPLIQIHDDIRSEVTEKVAYQVACIKKSVMEHAVKLDIPTPVEIKTGYNWKELTVLEI